MLCNLDGSDEWGVIAPLISELVEQLKASSQTYETVRDILLNQCLGSIKKFHENLAKVSFY